MMNYKSKTKEQLILELEELKQDYTSLKALYDKDIAKSKQNEIDLQISEAQKNAILNAISASITFVDRNLNIIWTNKTAANLVNKNANEMIGKTCHHFWGDPAKPCENCTSLKALETKQTEKNIIQTPNGKVWEEKSEPVFDAQGNLIGIVEIATDITALKLAEEEKRKADTRLRTLSKAIEQSPVTTVITDLAGNIEFVNPKFTETTGYTAEEAIGKNPRILKVGNKMVSEYKELWDTIISGKNWHGVFQNKKKNGEIYWESAVISPVKDEKGNITHFLAVKEDITERKQTEVALAQSRSELKAIYDFSPVMMCLVDAKRQIIFANPAFTALTGTDEVLLQGGHACGVFGCINATDDIRGCGFGSNCRNCSLRIAMEDTLKNGTVHLNVEYHTTLVQNGETRKVSLLGSTVLIENNNQRNLLLCLIDITERKQAEVLLQKSQDNLNKAQQLAHLGSWEWDMNSNLLTCSDEFYRIFGLKTQTPTINTDLLIDFIHPDDKEFYLSNLEKAANIGESQSFEYRIVRPDGEIRNIYASGSVVFDENNKPFTGTGVIQDITKRKKGVEALRESEKKYRLLTENTADVIWMLNLTTGKFTYVSPSVFQLRGYTAEEAMNERLEDSLTPDSIEIVKNAIEKNVAIFLANPELSNSYINEIQQYCKNGKLIWVEVSTQFQFASTGDIEVLGVSRNIEERKKAENALRASEEKFKAIIDTSPDGIAITALDGTIEFVTEKVVSLWGYNSADEIIGRNTMEFLHPDYHEKAIFFVTEMFNGILTGAAEYLMVRKDGSTFYCEANANILRDANNNPTGILYIERDITERKKVELSLKESEEKFRTVFYISPDAITLSRVSDNVIVSINKGFTDSLGYTEEDVVGKTTLHFDLWVDTNDRTRLFDILKTTGKVDNFEAWFYTKKRELRFGLMSMTILDINGEKHIVNITRDITERKQAEEKLRKSEQMLNESGRIAKLGGWEIDLTTKKLIWSEETYRIHEVELNTPQQMQDGINFYAPEAIPVLEKAIGLAMSEGTPFDLELPFITAKGNHLWVRSIGNADLSNGKAVRLYGVFQDVTERKLAEEALIQTSTRLTLATLAGGVGVWDWDVVNNLLLWDDQMFALYGLAKENFSGAYEAWQSVVHPDNIAQGEAEIQLALSGEKQFDTEFKVLWPDGSIHDIRALAIVQRSSSGKPLRMIGTNWDITEQKKTEALLVKAKQEAEMANKAKSIFLANMSHEIRTPLNAIIGFTQLMNRDKALTETQKEYNAAIIRSGEHLLMLINDILELSKMEAGRVVLNPVNVDLLTLFNDIQSIFKEKAQSKHLRFVFETAENIPHFVRVDESKLRQIFINLIGNALKFTDHGGITVSARVEKVIEGTSHLFVEIEDTGSGIAEDELSKLFNQFTQTSAGINKGSGTGLGLALSRELAILMGGNITVSSKVGKGSVFSFHVEVQDGQAETQNPVLAKRVISVSKGEKLRRILVVDDKKENLQVVVTLLNMVGFETIEAVNGEDAISKFGEYHPDLILMDLRMPVMDGYEATRRIKLTEKGKQTPIIALTASTFEGHKKRIETLGIQGYISKPFRETELFGIIGKVLGINYEYEEEKPLPQNINLMDEGAVSAAIGKLPESLKLPMLNAAAVADINLLKNLISSIHHDNEKLAMYLMEIAKNYDYDYMLKLLKNKGE